MRTSENVASTTDRPGTARFQGLIRQLRHLPWFHVKQIGGTVQPIEGPRSQRYSGQFRHLRRASSRGGDCKTGGRTVEMDAVRAARAARPAEVFCFT